MQVPNKGEKMKKCYIVGAGENYGLDIRTEEGDLVIAADAGYKTLLEAGITPDIVVGDFDTLKYIPDHPNVVRLSPIKDVTDTWEAVSIGLKQGYKEFHLYGCMGGRVEHTIANIQLLSHISVEGGRGYLYDEKNILTIIKGGERITFDAKENGFISVFSLTDSSGVNISGLKYNVTDAELTNTFPLGVSNEFIEKPSYISVSEGTLLIIYPQKHLTNP